MKVLHITRDLPPRVRGGLSVAVGGLVAAAAGSADQAVLSFDGWRPRAGGPSTLPRRSETAEGVPVLRLSSPLHLDAAADFAAAHAPDVVLVHHAMLYEVANRVAGDPPRALFVHVVQHALSAARGLSADTMSAAAQREALASADAVFVPSSAAAEALGVACTVLPLGVAPRLAAPIERDPRLVLCVGRYDQAKGTADVLAAVPQVLVRCPEARFVLAGGLPDSPKSERRWVRRWTQSASAAERAAVRFTGWLPPDAIDRIQRTAAVVVAPSWIETFGLAVLEAQQAGAAVVASDIPAHRELVTPGVSGVLVPPADVARLAEAIADLLADADLRAALGAAAASTSSHTRWPDRVGPHLNAWRRCILRGGDRA